MTKAYFTVVDGIVEIMMRAEGDGIVGDYHRSVAPGQEWHGLGYAALLAAGGGVIEFADDGSATIVPAQKTGGV